MRRWWPWLLLALLCAGFWLTGTPQLGIAPIDPSVTATTDGALSQPDPTPMPSPAVQAGSRLADFLSPEASDTIALIQRGGPFPYRQDGGEFGNREGRLPPRPRGWYREYTVETPGLDHRGGRRIVTGGMPPTQWYYTDDHYDSFRRFDPGAAPR